MKRIMNLSMLVISLMHSKVIRTREEMCVHFIYELAANMTQMILNKILNVEEYLTAQESKLVINVSLVYVSVLSRYLQAFSET